MGIKEKKMEAIGNIGVIKRLYVLTAFPRLHWQPV